MPVTTLTDTELCAVSAYMAAARRVFRVDCTLSVDSLAEALVLTVPVSRVLLERPQDLLDLEGRVHNSVPHACVGLIAFSYAEQVINVAAEIQRWRLLEGEDPPSESIYPDCPLPSISRRL